MTPVQSNMLRYREFCAQNIDIPLFLQAWWLDAETGAVNWNIVIAEDHGKIVGVLPYCLTRRWGFKGLGMPLIAKYSGAYIPANGEYKIALAEDRKHEIIVDLYRQLPVLAYHYQILFPGQEVNTSLLRLGYKYSEKHTCILPDIRNLENVFQSFEGRARTAIRKAEQIIEVQKEHDPDVLFEVMQATYRKQGKANYYTRNQLSRMLSAAFSNQCGHLYVARDSQSQVHAAAFTVWDRHICYDLVQGSVPEFLDSNAISLIVWKAIQDASRNGICHFDFTGSMIPGVQKYLRSFGAVLQPYYAVSKENSFPFRLLSRLREIKNRMKRSD